MTGILLQTMAVRATANLSPLDTNAGLSQEVSPIVFLVKTDYGQLLKIAMTDQALLFQKDVPQDVKLRLAGNAIMAGTILLGLNKRTITLTPRFAGYQMMANGKRESNAMTGTRQSLDARMLV